MTDTLETARECGLALLPTRPEMPSVRPARPSVENYPAAFDEMIARWHGVTYLLNNLNRSLGQRDSYPFVLSAPAIDKLRFVHELCRPDER